MKKVIIIMLLIVCATALLFPLTGCIGFPGYIVGSGDIVTKQFDYKDFNSVEVGSAFKFEITQSDTYSIAVSTRENIINYLDIHLSGKTLVVRLKTGSYTNADTQAVITMPEISRLGVSGASRGSAKGFKSTLDFKTEASGASQLELDMETGKTELIASGASKLTGVIKAQDTHLEVSGASRCELTGSAGTTDIEASGASQVELPDMTLQSASVNVSGASRAVVNTSGTLDIEASGASHVDYYGNPTLNNISISGASGINKK